MHVSKAPAQSGILSPTTWVPLAFPATNPSLARALAEQKYIDPTPVQTAVLQPEASGRDLLVSAQTGSGKTVAYGLAIAARLLGGADALGPPGAPIALVVAPTRELALQVQRELNWLYQHAGARVASCVGGMDPRQERYVLTGGVHIVVGTPGRLRDHLERGALNVAHIKALVLDEADEMLDLGFREDLEFILEKTPAERQTLLFSATLPKSIVTLAKHYQREALRIQTAGEEQGHADIEYRVVRIAARDTEHAIVNLLRLIDPPSALIFCNTRDMVRHLHATLQERGFSAVALSGELSQSERNHALQALRDGRARVCVATDVAARGIDLPQLGLVIHAELPNDAEVLQHRSGRTGRAGRKGVSILLTPPSERRRATQLLGWAGISAVWGEAPTRDAIRQSDQQRLLQRVVSAQAADEEDNAFAKVLMEKCSAEDIAATLARLYRAQLPAAEDLADPGRAVERERPNRNSRAKHEPYKNRDGRRDNSVTEKPVSYDTAATEFVWFRLDVGRQKNADPKWLVPMICRKGQITKREIGTIRVFDDETRFEIDARAAERFADSVLKSPHGDGQITPSSSPGDRAPAPPPPPRKPKRIRPGDRDWKPQRVTAIEESALRPPKREHSEKAKFRDEKKFAGKRKKGKAGTNATR
jgi:ATP-dependent RNA helicase DeaD